MLGTKHTYKPGVSDKNKELAKKQMVNKNPEKLSMKIEDRLI